jgi:DNA-binding LacI/PurR family transcriptional regulator
MTVSRVVTGNGYVSSELRRRIERTIARLGYSPNRIARSLKGASTNTIGVLLTDFANPFAADLARGIEEVVVPRGYYPFVVSVGAAASREDAAIRGFIDHRVAGAVLATRGCSLDSNAVADISKKRFPVVLAGPEFQAGKVDHVVASYRRGGFEATEHLIAAGRRRIAFIGSDPNDPHPLLRVQGYLDALNKHGIAPDPSLMIGPSQPAAVVSHEHGYDYMNRLLSSGRAPDAVFARNDYVAAGALRAMHEKGVSVPDDIAIVGFDNVLCAAFSIPPLTSVNQFSFDQGRRAAALLLDRIDSTKRPEPREEVFNCELVVRQSSALQALAA